MLRQVTTRKPNASLFQYETEHEAEQRRNYERCTETCDDFGVMSCAECRLPYEGYGCLRRRREVLYLFTVLP